jgi:hypothetical protein
MKKLHLLTLLILLSAISCKKDNIAKSDQYDTSYKVWLSYKANIRNSYKYTVSSGSWTGYGRATTTGISDGKIISRDFIAFKGHNDGSGIVDTLKSWHEDVSNINTHGEEAGALMTIDDIYTQARTVWLKADTKTNDIYFETDKNGVLSSCGFVPKGCQDDCFNGITITSISTL